MTSFTRRSTPVASPIFKTTALSMPRSSSLLASLFISAIIWSTSPLVRASSRSVSTRSCLPTPSLRLLAVHSSFSSEAVFSSSSARFFSNTSPTLTSQPCAASLILASCASKASTMASFLPADRPLLASRCLSFSMSIDLSFAFLAAASSSCTLMANAASTRSSLLPVTSLPLAVRSFLSSPTAMALNSFLLLAAASSSCFFCSLSLLRLASFARSASTMSPACAFLPDFAVGCTSSSSSPSGLGLAKRPSEHSCFTMRSTMTSLTKHSTPLLMHNSRKASLSIAPNSASRASRAIFAMALSTPSLSCHCFKSNSIRACFANMPLVPAATQRSRNSGAERASNSSFFFTSTSRIFAWCARWAARTAASCATTAVTMSSFLPASRPLPVARSFNSPTGIALSSFFLAAVISSSRRLSASSSLSSSSSSSSSSPSSPPSASSSTSSSASSFSSASSSCCSSFTFLVKAAFERLKALPVLFATALRFWIAMARGKALLQLPCRGRGKQGGGEGA
mmetsp:Transcript_91571/g.237309  ORF Transcript_91571/g.237309 Transcript_91571/m.237309 type:complete len:511 (+) Transcript_91571:463-1995(+)